MSLSCKQVAIGLGVVLFATQLGGKAVHADEVKVERVLPQISLVDEGSIPELPTEPSLPSEDVTQPSEPDTTPDGGGDSSDSTGGDTDSGGTGDSTIPDLPSGDVTQPSEPDTTPDGGGDSSDSTGGSTDSGGTEDSITPPVQTPDTDTSTPPVNNDGSNSGNTNQPNRPVQTPSTNQSTAKPPVQNVIVKPDGTIGGTTSAGSSGSNGNMIVPIETNNLGELTNVPTISTPVETNTGEKIVSVVDGVAYKQSENGELTPVSAEVKQLPSGNVAVTGADGKTKILPKTGTLIESWLSVIGVLGMAGTGFYYKKKVKE